MVDVSERDAVLGVLPLFHSLAQMANLLLPFAVGARVVYLETLNTTDLLTALAERRITIFCCVPQFFYLIHQRVTGEVAKGGWLTRTLFRALLAANLVLRRIGVNIGPMVFARVHKVLGGHMRLLITGGSKFDPAIGRDLYGLGFTILQAYGLTETSGAATITRPDEAHLDTVGRVLPGNELKILPPDGDAEDGEIAIRGPIVMQGYFNRPDATAEVDARRLVPDRRSRPHRRRRPGDDHRPQEGDDRPRLGQEHLPRGDRGALPQVDGDQGDLRARRHPPRRADGRASARRDRARPGRAEGAQDRQRRRPAAFRDGGPRRDVAGPQARARLRRVVRAAAAHDDRQIAALPRSSGVSTAQAVAKQAETAAPLNATDQEWLDDAHVGTALALVTRRATNTAIVRPDANLELDLGLDSMERVELLTELEQRFAVKVPEAAVHEIVTVRQLVEAVRPQAGNAGGAAVDEAWSAILGDLPPDTDPVLSRLLAPRRLMVPLLWVIGRVVRVLVARVRVQGLEHLPSSGPFLLCPNHQGFLDPFLLCGVLPYRTFAQMFVVGAADYFQTPFMAWVARQINCVPVDADASLVSAMKAGAFGLAHGKVLLLFPEGERSIDGTVKRFKKGAPILAQHLRVPIVPVAIRGAFEIWPRTRGIDWRLIWPWSGHRVRIALGAPLTVPEGESYADAAGAAARRPWTTSGSGCSNGDGSPVRALSMNCLAICCQGNDMNEERLALNRRRFFECLSAMGLGCTLMPDALVIAAQDSETVTVEMIEAAQKIAGVSFTREEQQAIVGTAERQQRLPGGVRLSAHRQSWQQRAAGDRVQSRSAWQGAADGAAVPEPS